MIIIPPLAVTDATLTSSNVPETDNAEWLVGTSYSIGNTVMVATTEPNIHKNYESLTNSNLGNQPWLDDGTNWLDLGATNRWAMFDQVVGTRTTNADSVNVDIDPGKVINGVAALNVSASTVQVIMTDPIEGVVYDSTINMISDSGINDWYAYYFSPIERTTAAVFTDLPSYLDATIQVIATETGATVAVGVLAIGAQVKIGTTDHGTGVSIKDYSIKDTDAFGNFIIVKRAFSKRADYAVTVETRRTGFIQNYLASITSIPVVWIGNKDFGATVIYGFYRDFDIVLSSPQISDCNISVEGLT